MTIALGIAYNADLEKCRQLISGLLEADERISKTPAAVVQYEQFGSSSIEIRIHFWTRHIAEAYATRSDLIVAIATSLRDNHIEIPVQRLDALSHPDHDKLDEKT